MARVRGADIADEAAAFLRCRTYSHAWDEFYPIDLEQPRYGWRLSLRCTRCGSERHDSIGWAGQMMSRRYIYAEGYLSPKGEPKVEKTIFREELFTQLRARLEEVNAVGTDAEVVPIKRARKRSA